LDPVTNVVAVPDPLTPPATPSPSCSVPSSPSLSDLRAALPSVPNPLTNVFVHDALSYGGQLRFNAAIPLQYGGLSPAAFHGVAPPGFSQPGAGFHHELDFLAEPATSPPLPSLTLTCDPFLPWHIEVHPSLPNLFVTVYDVLQTLNANLRIPLSDSELSLFISEQTYASIVDAYQNRLNAIRDIREREEQRAKSVRRIDCLIGRTKLLGLQWVGVDNPDVFTIGWGWP